VPLSLLKSFVRAGFCALSIALASIAVQPAQAQSLFGSNPNAGLTDFDRDVFFFGGRFQHDWIWDTLNVAADHYEDNYVLGAGYQQFFTGKWWGFRMGTEFGIAGRFAHDGVSTSSFETWYGYTIRHDGIAIGDAVRIGLAVSTGFSMVTDLIGIERVRAGWYPENGPVQLLFYLGPEINLTAAAFPNWELFFRIHHRSGLYGTIAKVDGSNAAALGFRYKF
jgi:hypothetical protein